MLPLASLAELEPLSRRSGTGGWQGQAQFESCPMGRALRLLTCERDRRLAGPGAVRIPFEWVGSLSLNPTRTGIWIWMAPSVPGPIFSRRSGPCHGSTDLPGFTELQPGGWNRTACAAGQGGPAAAPPRLAHALHSPGPAGPEAARP